MEKSSFFRWSVSSETGDQFALELGGYFDRFSHISKKILKYLKFTILRNA